MTFGMEPVDAPVFDLREVLVFRNRFHADAHLVVDDTVNSSSSIEHLFENLLGNRDVLRVLHVGHGQDQSTCWVHRHKPAVLTVLRLVIFAWSPCMCWGCVVTLGSNFFMPVNHDLFDLTPLAKRNLLLMPPGRVDLQEVGMERILDLDGEEPTAVCGLGGGPHL